MQVDILGSVDQCHTEDEIALQRRDLVLSTPRVFVHAPGALPEHQDCLAGWELRVRMAVADMLNLFPSHGRVMGCFSRSLSGREDCPYAPIFLVLEHLVPAR